MAQGTGILTLISVAALVVLTTGCGTTSPTSNLDHRTASAEATPIVQAASAGNLDEVQELASDGASLNTLTESGTPLSAAVSQRQDDVVLFLLQQGADPDLAGPDGVTPLMVAAGMGERRLVRMLLSAGAEVNARGRDGTTPVMMAARSGELSVVKILLSAGANVNVSQDGRSLLMQIVEQGDLLTAEALVAAGADVNYRSDEGLSALDLARANNNQDLEMLLVQAGASQ